MVEIYRPRMCSGAQTLVSKRRDVARFDAINPNIAHVPNPASQGPALILERVGFLGHDDWFAKVCVHVF